MEAIPRVWPGRGPCVRGCPCYGRVRGGRCRWHLRCGFLPRLPLRYDSCSAEALASSDCKPRRSSANLKAAAGRTISSVRRPFDGCMACPPFEPDERTTPRKPKACSRSPSIKGSSAPPPAGKSQGEALSAASRWTSGTPSDIRVGEFH
jgi:hypothetical protein